MINPSLAATYLRDHATPINITKCKPPDVSDFENYLETVSHSSCGPDGIPYLAWKRLGDLGVDILFDVEFSPYQLAWTCPFFPR